MDARFNAFPKREEEFDSLFFSVTAQNLGRCSGRQRAYIHGLMEKAQCEFDELVDYLKMEDKESLRQFSVDEAAKAIDLLKMMLGWN